MTNPGSAKSNIAKAGLNILKRLVFDENTISPDNRRTEERTNVVGEVTIIPLDAEGNPKGQAKVFIRDISKKGCGLWSRIGFDSGTRLVIRFPGMNGAPPMQRIAMVCHSRGTSTTGFAIGCRFVNDLVQLSA